LAAIAAALPERPRAVLVVSAHWERPGSLVCAAARPETIHDFGGFPEELYRAQYPAPGEPELARETASLVPDGRTTLEWGLDHGAWTVLRHAFPAADLPCFQLSIDAGKSLREQRETGRALSPLRDRGRPHIGIGQRGAQPGAPRMGRGSLSLGGGIRCLGRGATLGGRLGSFVRYLTGRRGAAASFPYLGMEHGSLSMRCVLWS